MTIITHPTNPAIFVGTPDEFGIAVEGDFNGAGHWIVSVNGQEQDLLCLDAEQAFREGERVFEADSRSLAYTAEDEFALFAGLYKAAAFLMTVSSLHSLQQLENWLYEGLGRVFALPPTSLDQGSIRGFCNYVQGCVKRRAYNLRLIEDGLIKDDYVITEKNVSERVKRAEKHVNEQLSYGGIFPGTGSFGSTFEYRYQGGDLVDEIGQMRRLADALNSLADALEPEAD